jgi:hypothetical protein
VRVKNYICLLIVLDTSSFSLPRVRSILLGNDPDTSATILLSRIHSLSIRSLPSLLALLLHSAHTDTSLFATVPNLTLVVVDDLSTPILATYPHGFEDDISRSKSNRREHRGSDSAATKRTNLLKELANKLVLLAVKRNIAVTRYHFRPDGRS